MTEWYRWAIMLGCLLDVTISLHNIKTADRQSEWHWSWQQEMFSDGANVWAHLM